MGSNLEKFCWGTKEKLIESDYLLIDKLYIKRGGYSSIHYHLDQTNDMIVLKGSIDLYYFNSAIIIKDSECLIIGERSKLIKPFINHQFKANQDSIVIEIIHTDNINKKVSRNDIVRLTERGIENA